jgi:hypothetical protein
MGCECRGVTCDGVVPGYGVEPHSREWSQAGGLSRAGMPTTRPREWGPVGGQVHRANGR